MSIRTFIRRRRGTVAALALVGMFAGAWALLPRGDSADPVTDSMPDSTVDPATNWLPTVWFTPGCCDPDVTAEQLEALEARLVNGAWRSDLDDVAVDYRVHTLVGTLGVELDGSNLFASIRVALRPDDSVWYVDVMGVTTDPTHARRVHEHVQEAEAGDNREYTPHPDCTYHASLDGPDRRTALVEAIATDNAPRRVIWPVPVDYGEDVHWPQMVRARLGDTLYWVVLRRYEDAAPDEEYVILAAELDSSASLVRAHTCDGLVTAG